MRIRWGAAAILAAGLAGAASGAHSATNDYSKDLERQSPAQRAARLAAVVGYWCVGTDTFLMGVPQSGPEAGFAYWSVACLDGSSYAIQIDPLGRPVTIDCAVLAAAGQGKECFKKF